MNGSTPLLKMLKQLGSVESTQILNKYLLHKQIKVFSFSHTSPKQKRKLLGHSQHQKPHKHQTIDLHDHTYLRFLTEEFLKIILQYLNELQLDDKSHKIEGPYYFLGHTSQCPHIVQLVRIAAQNKLGKVTPYDQLVLWCHK